MKAVLMSIQLKWIEKITKDEMRTVLEKTKPKKETPLKCYMYCIKNRDNEIYKRYKVDDIKSGKVIGEFVCDRIEKYDYDYCPHPELGYNIGDDCGDNWYNIDDEELQKTGLTNEDFKKYGKGKDIYGWHISNLKIYDKPKELGEFYRLDNIYDYSFGWVFKEYGEEKVPIKRPPQSWFYVEKNEEE